MKNHTKIRRNTALVAMACVWAAFLSNGHGVSIWITSRYSGVLQKIANEKFHDPVTFVHGRLGEFLMLATLAITLLFVASWFWKWLGTVAKWNRLRGLIMGVGVFLLLNLYAFAAGKTVLFWAMFYDKIQIDNFAQYQIKRTLLGEIEGRRRAILIGNSQANRSIDEVLMNRMIGKSLWTTELTQAGARGFDLLTLSHDIPLEPGDLVICYLSEIMFYGRGSSGVTADFMNFSGVSDVYSLDGWRVLPVTSIRSGLLGRVMPLYRFRNSLSHRTLGPSITNLNQLRFDQSLESDLEEQARIWAPKLGIGETSQFEEAAFSRMVGELSKKGCTILVISGHTHPALRRQMDPRVLEHLNGYLKELASSNPDGMILLDASRIFVPTESDFMDLVHFNDQAQQRFSRELSEQVLRLIR